MVARSIVRSVSRGDSRVVSDYVPTDKLYFDFVKKRFFSDGETRSFSDMPSQFIRLSSATMWQDGQLVEVANNVPRISEEGLLIEPQRTNLYPDNHRCRFLWSDGTSSITTEETVTPSPYGEHAFTLRCTGIRARSYYMYDLYATISSGVRNTRSFLIRPSENVKSFGCETYGTGRFFLRYTIATKEISTSGNRIATVRELGDGWFHAAVTEDAPSTTTTRSIFTVTAEYIDEESESHFLACGFQTEEYTPSSSYIPTSGAQVTRSPDILNIPLLPSQTITGDWDAGVTYEVADNIATFTGHGYIRSMRVN